MNNIRPKVENETGYKIQLANDQRWQIIATKGVRSWVRKLASIMELKPCDRNGYPKLIFIRREHDEPVFCRDPGIDDCFPRSGWEARRFPAVQIWSHRCVPDKFCEIGHENGHELEIFRMLQALYPIFERAQESGGLPLHTALVERDGIGILLVASGNTGKSTCCHRLRNPWHPLCDDEALVVRDDQKRYLAHPLPTWSDHFMKRSERTWGVEGYVPLSAIFFLEQSERDEVFTMGKGKAAVLMSQSSMDVYHPTWKRLDIEELRILRKNLFDNACDLAKEIPSFRLGVSLGGRFWEKIEEVLP